MKATQRKGILMPKPEKFKGHYICVRAGNLSYDGIYHMEGSKITQSSERRVKAKTWMRKVGGWFLIRDWFQNLRD